MRALDVMYTLGIICAVSVMRAIDVADLVETPPDKS